MLDSHLLQTSVKLATDKASHPTRSEPTRGPHYEGQLINVVYTNNPVNYQNDTNTLCGNQTCSVLKMTVNAVTTQPGLNDEGNQTEHSNLLTAL